MSNMQGAAPAVILKDKFGYEHFKPGQEALIMALMEGRDCLGVMPTGAGKSLCYQIPACALEGVALVVSPLISLMADQVHALAEAGISAAFINSTLSAYEQAQALRAAATGAIDVLYVAPERLDDPRFVEFARQAKLAFVAVDEAHCVSQWGQDFRPAYLGIGAFVEELPARPPVAAFTATATERVRGDIVRLLGLCHPQVEVTGFDRPNLYFGVEQQPAKRKLERIIGYARDHASDAGIVYCSTRDDTERVCEALRETGIAATRYHAGLSAAERTANQRAFVNDEALVMVATNAFGMGIDKSNVRYVIHHNMPSSLEAYYQEAGRAGRDGAPAYCLLLWNDGDIGTCRYFVEQDMQNEALSAEEAEVVRASKRRLLESMVGYCMTCRCLRAHILDYFGEIDSSNNLTNVNISSSVNQNKETCSNCSNCEGLFEAVDVTTTARSVMRCVHELRGRFGKGMVADVLCGSKSAKVRDFGLDRARTYGDAANESAPHVKDVIELLASEGYLEISEGRYPLVGLGPRMREAAADDFRLLMKRQKRQSQQKAAGGRKISAEAAQGSLTTDQADLFERLRALRLSLARSQGIAPYMVFSDATLRDMCVKRPSTKDEFSAVSGVGAMKLERYGDAFLAEINREGA